MKYLLDTCVLSETVKPKPDEHVLHWFHETDRMLMYTPAVVLGELRKGIVRMPQGLRRNLLEGWLERYRTNYFRRIVAFDAEVAHSWGTLVGRLQSKGVTLPIIDSQIAATAMCHDMTLVTRNIKDMEPTGVRLFNPFE